jgi:hypothetical protein
MEIEPMKRPPVRCNFSQTNPVKRPNVTAGSEKFSLAA